MTKKNIRPINLFNPLNGKRRWYKLFIPHQRNAIYCTRAQLKLSGRVGKVFFLPTILPTISALGPLNGIDSPYTTSWFVGAIRCSSPCVTHSHLTAPVPI
ncbi:MAG TPA: hypothetical protein ENI48_09105 [Thioploca sp.]|nr:hypothetical protein [Thioploca sp.]